MTEGAGSSERTIALDGLRGWAALVVLLFHCFVEIFPVSANSAQTLRSIPLFNGALAVCAFFVISGFCLSTSYIAHRDAGRLARMAAGRYLRLAIPIGAACGLVCVAMTLGFIRPPHLRPAPINQVLLFEPNLLHVVRFAVFDVFLDYNMQKSYILPLWTMQYELFGSFLVFGLLATLGRWRYRLTFYVFLYAAFLSQHSFYSLFILGLIIAELHQRKLHLVQGARVLLIVVFLATASVPFLIARGQIPIYYTLIGGFCAAVIGVAGIGRFFENRLSQFLGEVSFPLYLLHGPMFYSVSLWAMSALDGSGLSAGWSQGTIHFVVGLITIMASFGAAVAFRPVNDYAVVASRRFGSWSTAALRRTRQVDAVTRTTGRPP